MKDKDNKIYIKWVFFIEVCYVPLESERLIKDAEAAYRQRPILEGNVLAY